MFIVQQHPIWEVLFVCAHCCDHTIKTQQTAIKTTTNATKAIKLEIEKQKKDKMSFVNV